MELKYLEASENTSPMKQHHISEEVYLPEYR